MNSKKKNAPALLQHAYRYNLTRNEYRNGTVNNIFKQDVFTGKYLSTPAS